MKTAIVTGATSFIAIALITDLLKCDYNVIAVIRPNSRRKDILKRRFRNVRIVECELGSMYEINDAICEGNGADCFFHVGWSSDFDNPRYNIAGQMMNVCYVADAIRTANVLGCKKVLVVGSQAECGLVNAPINSETPDAPITAYAKAKCEAYRRGCELCDELGMDFYWPRLLSAYGPYDRPGTLVMSCIAACINRGEMAMTNAEQIWDYVYVGDVAQALRLVVEKGEPKKKYSIASGAGKQLREYIKEISEVFEYEALMEGLGKRKYAEKEVMYLVGDVSEIHNDTGMTFDTDFRKHISEAKYGYASWING